MNHTDIKLIVCVAQLKLFICMIVYTLQTQSEFFLSHSRVVGELWCRWRRCRQLGRTWHSRQALLQHITKAHCTVRIITIIIIINKPLFGCIISFNEPSRHISCKIVLPIIYSLHIKHYSCSIRCCFTTQSSIQHNLHW